MSIKTQIRLQQVTGSVPSVTIGQGSQDPGAADVQELMAAYAKAIANIHGDQNFLAQVPGRIEHSSNSILIKTDASAGGSLKLEAPNADDGIILEAGNVVSGSAAAVRLQTLSGKLDLLSAGKAELFADDSSSDAIQVQAPNGGMELTAGALMNGAADRFQFTASTTTGGEGFKVSAGPVAQIDSSYSGGGSVDIRAGGGSGASSITMGLYDASFDGNSSRLQLSHTAATFLSNNPYVAVEATADAQEADQGALRVTGGMGVGANLHVGADLVVTGTRLELVDADAALEFGEDTHRIVSSTTANSFQIESGLKLALTGASGVEIHSDGSSAGVSLQADAAGIYMSGSNGISFQTDGTHAGFNNAVDLATYGEGPTWETAFTGKSIFGAMLDLNSKIASNEATRFEEALTADVLAVSGEYPVQVIYVAGDNTSMTLSEWTDLGKNKLDVYVNGQLLRSGSTDSPSDDKEDYVLDASTVRTIKFQFPILTDDVVVAIER